jgi:hypothetical protein
MHRCALVRDLAVVTRTLEVSRRKLFRGPCGTVGAWRLLGLGMGSTAESLEDGAGGASADIAEPDELSGGRQGAVDVAVGEGSASRADGDGLLSVLPGSRSHRRPYSGRWVWCRLYASGLNDGRVLDR